MQVWLFLLFAITANAQWLKVNQGGEPMYTTEPNAMPTQRSQPLMWCLGDDVYIYGGIGPNDEKLTDLWKFETETNRWFWQPDPPAHVYPNPGEPTWTKEGRLWFNWWSYNPIHRQWFNETEFPYMPDVKLSFWFYPPTETMYLYDGIRIQILKPGADVWDNLPITGQKPAIMGPTRLIGNTVFLYARELYQYDVSTSVWSIANASVFHDIRSEVAMLIDSRTDSPAIFGGRVGAEIFSDTWIWQNNEKWVQLFSAGPPARWGSGTCVNSQTGETFLFGGATDDPTKKFNDLWKFGPLTKQNIFELLDFQFNSTALASYISATFIVMTFVLFVVSLLVWGICACRRRKRKVMSDLELKLTKDTDRAFESAEDF